MILHCGSVTFLGGKSPDGLVGTWKWVGGGDPPSPLQCYGKGRGPTITPKVVHMGGCGGGVYSPVYGDPFSAAHYK